MPQSCSTEEGCILHFIMIWNILIISLGLVSARTVSDAESEYLNGLEKELAVFEDSVARADDADGAESEFLNELEEELARFEDDKSPVDAHENSNTKGYFNRVSELGDILLTDEQARQGINFKTYTASRWPNGRIPYTIEKRHFSDSDMTKINNAIADFNRRLAPENKVQLVKRSRERDYVKIISGEGCYSYLGRTGGEQLLSLQRTGCLTPQTIQHEFMHAIGFTHEQNRSDRDQYVDVLWGNIPSEWHPQYQKVNENDFNNIGEYEWYSIMHYPWWSPDGSGKDAFGIKGQNINKRLLGEGENKGATKMDIAKINALYS